MPEEEESWHAERSTFETELESEDVRSPLAQPQPAQEGHGDQEESPAQVQSQATEESLPESGRADGITAAQEPSSATAEGSDGPGHSSSSPLVFKIRKDFYTRRRKHNRWLLIPSVEDQGTMIFYNTYTSYPAFPLRMNKPQAHSHMQAWRYMHVDKWSPLLQARCEALIAKAGIDVPMAKCENCMERQLQAERKLKVHEDVKMDLEAFQRYPTIDGALRFKRNYFAALKELYPVESLGGTRRVESVPISACFREFEETLRGMRLCI